MVVEPYLVVCGLLLLGSLLARGLPAVRHSDDCDHEDGWDLSPREVAYLRRGPYGVVLTVLADLHGEGAVDLGHGRTRRLDPPRDLDDRLAVAVHSGLTWSRAPRLLALLPRVRRACAPLRAELRERALLPPVRRTVFAAALRASAMGLALGCALEADLPGSTVAGAAAVCVLAVVLPAPRRTLAGYRELAQHRAALRAVAADGMGEAAYLADLVAAHGVGALQVLCRDYIPAGALAPPMPAYEPVPAPLPAPIRLPVPRRLDRDRLAVAA